MCGRKQRFSEMSMLKSTGVEVKKADAEKRFSDGKHRCGSAEGSDLQTRNRLGAGMAMQRWRKYTEKHYKTAAYYHIIS